jgi:hypothetical protein
MRFLMLHGCTSEWNASSQSCRNYVSESVLWNFLRENESLRDFVHLSVDDSTMGAARACQVAIDAGYSVTYFVNPWQIIEQSDYWFSRMDALLDANRRAKPRMGDRLFDLAEHASLRELRQILKTEARTLSHACALEFIECVASEMRLTPGDSPEFARVVSLGVVRELKENGVTIGSHGWDHQCISALGAQFNEDLRRANEWIDVELGSAPSSYAVPYGIERLPASAVQPLGLVPYLADARLSEGHVGDYVNRIDFAPVLRARSG